ncbi:MAG: DNA-directed RNA polymerase subunit alpha [Patescibacteria group bacterium]
MKYISLPKKFIVEEEARGTKAKIIIEPCYPGYGLTLGNALRRVMLSSLPGGAVTAVKIKGVGHEFSAIKNVSEDVVDIILNLKQLRIKVYADEPVTLQLKARGEKKVTGADIEPSSDAEVINKDCFIASLNDKDGELEMELTVAKGVGYVPTEEQVKSKGKGEIGLILVDSIFTPVLNVRLNIEATRVGQRVDYDKIVLEIETDGTISPEEALQKAAEILANQFSWLMEGGRQELVEVDLEAPVALPENKEAELLKEVASSDGLDESQVAAETEVVEDKPKKRGRPKKVE